MCFFPEKEGQIYKRMFLVGIALYAIVSSQQAVHHDLKHYQGENSIQCLKMYFSATTDPFLTIFEVRSVLYACCNVLNKGHLYDIYSEVFDNIMPECPSNIEPRTLADLARYQVRQNTKVSKVPLTAAVDKLPLPKILKAFVKGDVTDLSIKRVNASSHNTVTKSQLAAMFYQRPLI